MINKLTIPVTLVVVLFCIKLMNPGLYDPDFFWHLKTGEYIVSHHMLPASDIYSFTVQGKPWVLHEWLTEVALYAVAHVFGFAGIRILVSLFCAATFYVLLSFVRKVLNNDARASLLSIAFFVPVLMFVAPRPQLFSFLFFALFLFILLDFKYFGRTKYFFCLPLIMAVWANLHGAFVVGLVLFALFLGAEWTQLMLGADRTAEGKRDLRRLTFFFAGSVLVTLLNPHFIDLWIYPFQVVSMEVAQGWIGEWRSPDFHDHAFKYVLFLILGFFLVLIYSKKKPDLTEIVIPLFFIVSSMVAARHIPLACFVLLLFAAVFYRHRTDLNLRPAANDSRMSALLRKPPEIRSGLLPKLNLVMLVAVISVVVQVEIAHREDDPAAATMPVKAADFIVQHGITGNMLNNYDNGGYLIYRFAPERKVFIDGRADVYGDAFISEFREIYLGSADWKQKFDKFNIDFVLCGVDAPIRQLLMAEGSFKEAYKDASFSVLLRDVPKYHALLAMQGTSK